MRHSRGERIFGVVGETENARRLVTLAQDLLHDAGVVPFAGVGPLIRCARGPCLIKRVAQNVRLRVCRDCDVGRLIECQDPTVRLLIVGAAASLVDEHLVEAAQQRSRR